MKTIQFDAHNYPETCPNCNEKVFRWYHPTYDSSLFGEDTYVNERYCVTEKGLAMHLSGENGEPDMKAGDDYRP